MPKDERLAIKRHLCEFDRLGADLKVIERDRTCSALVDEGVMRLMTISGIDMVAGLATTAAIGDISRFSSLRKLASSLGLNPHSKLTLSMVGFH
ncbi:UNVERIFIED_ORG: transposase [Xanthobacter viscosus]|uniref:transposase n=1 Tax=Xanthobacter autotrophicus TaxID=280 RepID=UPI0014772827|nr:transposase [Xanthobacter autotrophicus]